MADHIHLFKPGTAITCAAGTAVIGGRLVQITGPRQVGPAAADSVSVFGTAAVDTEVGGDVLVLRGGVQNLTASAVITAGARVKAAADGKVVTVGTSEAGLGLALTTVTAADQPIQIALD